MKKRGLAMLLIALMSIPLVALAELVTASSDPFTFPAIDNIKQRAYSASAPVFSFRGLSTTSNAISLCWSIPATVEALKGRITLYSLQGKAIMTFDLKTRSGSTTWKIPRGQAKSGVLVARLSCGSHVSTLKLVLCR